MSHAELVEACLIHSEITLRQAQGRRGWTHSTGNSNSEFVGQNPSTEGFDFLNVETRKSVSTYLYLLRRHDEQRLHLETAELGAQTLSAIVLVHIDQFFAAGDNVDRNTAIPSVFDNYQSSVDPFEN